MEENNPIKNQFINSNNTKKNNVQKQRRWKYKHKPAPRVMRSFIRYFGLIEF